MEARPKNEARGCGGALSDGLGGALGVLFRAYSKAAAAAVAEIPGGPRGYQVLTAVARSDPRSQLELANHLGLDRTVMTYLLDDLERAGSGRPAGPADRGDHGRARAGVQPRQTADGGRGARARRAGRAG